jgi:N-methylhydantoinase A
MAEIATRFHARHEELFTYSLPDQDAVLVNARLATIGELPSLPAEPLVADRAEAPATGNRRIYLGGWTNASVYNLEELAPRQKIVGPAIVESATTTVVLRAGDTAITTGSLWLDVALAG